MPSVGELTSRSALQTLAETVTVAEVATGHGLGEGRFNAEIAGGRLIGIFTERDMVRAISRAPESAGDPIPTG